MQSTTFVNNFFHILEVLFFWMLLYVMEAELQNYKPHPKWLD